MTSGVSKVLVNFSLLSGCLPKSGPLDFATKSSFPLFFVGEEAFVGRYLNRYFCFNFFFLALLLAKNELSRTRPLRECFKNPHPQDALVPCFGGGEGKGPGIGQPTRHFDWLIDLGNSCKKVAKWK